MAIGNPITLTSNVASKTISVIATAGQTLFTVTGGYRINQLAVFRNGVRLLDSRDYEARNGATVTLLSAATVGDALEFQVFDDFRVADAIVSAESEQTISGNLTVSGILTATDLRGSDVTFRHVKATGISTFSDTTQSTSTTTGALIISGGVGIAKSLFVGGDMSVAGTLTYEDVTNVETAGITTTGGLVVTGLGATFGSISTHFSNIEFGAAGVGGTITPLGHAEFVGVVTASSFSGDGSGLTGVASTDNINTSTLAQFTGQVGIADSIFHIGDTDTSIRFPAANTFTVETGGSERIRVDSSGNFGVGTNNPGFDLEVVDSSGDCVIALQSPNSSNTEILFGDPDSSYSGRIRYGHSTNHLQFNTNASERVRITSDGELFVGTTSGDSTYQTHIKHDTFGLLKLETTNTSTDGSYLVLYHNSSSPADDDQLGIISFIGENDADEEIAYAQIRGFSGDVTDGTEDGYITFNTRAAGSFGERLRIDSSGRLLLACTTPPNTDVNAGLQIQHTGTANITLARDDSSITDGNALGRIDFYGNDGGTFEHCATIAAQADGAHANGDKPMRLIFGTSSDGTAGTPTERLRINSSGAIGVGGANFGSSGQVLTSNGSGSAVTWEDASGGISTQAGNASGIVTSMFLTDATDHKVTATGICTITTTQSGTEGQSHTIRVVNSGIATVGFSTYFLFPSGSAPSLPTADGAVSLISFTVHDSVGAGCTQLLAGVSVNFS